ncbi:hypothetical protein [cf. Phormidesmis sp. LEGE 11477]|uniref:hypothetical protein n=1 Tax=cf. Phormidesmis sp. LEGE 11477 TaxID=1828680 RepID=UPI0018806C09|nr:hypothetical protein [cf. Phormidesmis sp. LEGE 11477]MBE9064357.1 hypothetical protein [cf. Phormidesmis sp. LEGE 11477]
MIEHTLTLPEQIYRSLVAVAQAQGMSPASWIASQLSEQLEDAQPAAEPPTEPAASLNDRFITPVGIQQKPLSELLIGLTGTIDSSARCKEGDKENCPYGESLIDKFAKQGIHLP